MVCNKPNVVRQVKLEKDLDREFSHVFCPAGYKHDVDAKYECYILPI
jgi:hypothetical protein